MTFQQFWQSLVDNWIFLVFSIGFGLLLYGWKREKAWAAITGFVIVLVTGVAAWNLYSWVPYMILVVIGLAILRWLFRNRIDEIKIMEVLVLVILGIGLAVAWLSPRASPTAASGKLVVPDLRDGAEMVAVAETGYPKDGKPAEIAVYDWGKVSDHRATIEVHGLDLVFKYGVIVKKDGGKFAFPRRSLSIVESEAPEHAGKAFVERSGPFHLYLRVPKGTKITAK